MKKFSMLLCPLFFVFCLLFGACRNTNAVYSIYADGEYESTLSERNAYLLSDPDRVKEKIESEKNLVLVLIGAAWCPYCASDVGPIDERFRQSTLFTELEKIYYIDADDSQRSTETIMEFNRAYGWNMRTRIPCLMAVREQTLVAVITDETFTAIEDRTERIDAFFSFIEQSVDSK